MAITDGHMVGSAVGRIDGDTMGSAFLNSGFALRRGVSFYEKAEQVTHAPLRC
ncbi:MAG: hypothetical protein ABIR83_03315 [Nakamurella sp.]